jgi:serine/threonine protein kinase
MAADPPRDSSDPEGATRPPAPANPAPAPAYRNFEPGDQVGEFRILGAIGAGGMGTVYEAEQLNPRRRVALKVLRGGSVVDEADIRMFAREIASLARLKHPNIATIHASGWTDSGRQYFAMELVTGESLDVHFRRTAGEGGLEPQEVERRIRLVGALCRAVGYAHQRGVIHRDLKPGNVMVSEEAPSDRTSTTGSSSGRSSGSQVYPIKVLDFGLARITDNEALATRGTDIGTVLGTLAYMSPEQASGRIADIDLRTDVYSLGVLLYEALTGVLPMSLSGLPFVEALRKLTQETPRPLSETWRGRRPLDPDLSTIVMKALAREPADRYESAIALADDLDRYLAGEPIHARPASTWYQLRKMAARHRGQVVAGFALLLMLIGVAVTMTVQARRIAEERDRASQEAARANAVQTFLQETLGSADPWGGGGRRVTVAEALEAAARKADDTFASQPALRAEILSVVGVTLGGLGQVTAAESLNRVVLDIQRNELGAQPLALAERLRTIGNYLWLAGHPADADSVLRVALAEVARARRGGAPSLAADTTEFNVLATLGQAVVADGRYSEADSVADRLDAMAVRLGPPGGMRTVIALTVRNSLAHALQQFDVVDSVNRLEYEIRRRHQGPRHPATLIPLNNLALNELFRGNVASAESLFAVLLDGMEDVLGTDHPHYASAIENSGQIPFSKGDYDGTIAALQRVIDIRRRGLGDDSPLVYRTMANMAAVYQRRGPPEKAIETYTEALAGFERTMGAGHPETAVLLMGRGLCHETSGNLNAAESDIRRALDLRRSTLPDDHPYLASNRLYYGLLLTRLGRGAEADSLLERGIAIRERTAPAEDALLIRAREALAKRRGG